MWIVTNTLNVPPEASAHVAEAFKRSVPDMEAFEGFLGLELWRREDGSLLAVTRWASREAFERYPQSEAFRRHHAGVDQGQGGGGGAQVSQYASLL